MRVQVTCIQILSPFMLFISLVLNFNVMSFRGSDTNKRILITLINHTEAHINHIEYQKQVKS